MKKNMKVIIAGSRSLTGTDLISQAMIESNFKITEVVSGMARGIDQTAAQYAKKLNIPVKEFPMASELASSVTANWDLSRMANYADALIVVWDGHSKGTLNMMKAAKARAMPIYCVTTLECDTHAFDKAYGSSGWSIQYKFYDEKPHGRKLKI